MKSCLITRLSRRRFSVFGGLPATLSDRLRADMGLAERPARPPAQPFPFLSPLMRL